MKLSVVIPVYNEIQTIGEILHRVRSVDLSVPRGYGRLEETTVCLDREIVVVDDGSSDGTRAFLRRIAADPDTVVVFHEKLAALKHKEETVLRNALTDTAPFINHVGIRHEFIARAG